MDPKECLKLLLEAIRDGDHLQAAEHARNLADWLDNAGFMPSADDLSAICDNFVEPPLSSVGRMLREDIPISSEAIHEMYRADAAGTVVTPLSPKIPSGWPYQPAPRPPGVDIIPHNSSRKDPVKEARSLRSAMRARVIRLFGSSTDFDD